MLGSWTAAKSVELGWETWATYAAHPVEIPGCRMLRVDITDSEQVRNAVGSVGPDAVIHCAAQVRPDVCEIHKSEAFASNVTGTVNVKAACEEVGCHLIFVSTDLVFSGEHNPYSEVDLLSPPNYYGLTKVAGETAVYTADTSWAIARTSTIYGPRMFPHLNSYSDKVIEALQAGRKVPSFTDQRRCAVLVWNVADVLLEIAGRRLSGIFHAVAPDSCTRYEFALKIAEVFGLDPEFIDACSQYSVEAAAYRPETIILDTTSTAEALNTRLIGWEEGIQELFSRR